MPLALFIRHFPANRDLGLGHGGRRKEWKMLTAMPKRGMLVERRGFGSNSVIDQSSGSGGGTIAAMVVPESTRLFNCSRCGRLVTICRQCDRGNRYCGRECAGEARRGALREANQRYLATARDRQLHAERQARYPARKEDPARRVTDHSANLRPVTLREDHQQGFDHCHFCGRGPILFQIQRTGRLARRSVSNRGCGGHPASSPLSKRELRG